MLPSDEEGNPRGADGAESRPLPIQSDWLVFPGKPQVLRNCDVQLLSVVR